MSLESVSSPRKVLTCINEPETSTATAAPGRPMARGAKVLTLAAKQVSCTVAVNARPDGQKICRLPQQMLGAYDVARG